jgi:hypothetical protein
LKIVFNSICVKFGKIKEDKTLVNESLESSKKIGGDYYKSHSFSINAKHLANPGSFNETNALLDKVSKS